MKIMRTTIGRAALITGVLLPACECFAQESNQRCEFNNQSLLHLVVNKASFGSIDTIIDDCLRRMRSHPQNRDYPYQMGRLYDLKGDYLKALEIFRSTLKMPQSHRNTLTYSLLALTYERMGLYDEALAHHEQSLVAARAVTKDPEVLSNIYTARAELHQKLGNRTPALADITEAIQLFPNDERYSLRAKIYMEDRQYAAALVDWERFSKNGVGRTNYIAAVCLLRLGRWSEAITRLSEEIAWRAAKKDGSTSELHSMRGDAYRGAGNLDLAIIDYRTALDLGYHHAHFGLGMLYTAREQWAEVIGELEALNWSGAAESMSVDQLERSLARQEALARAYEMVRDYEKAANAFGMAAGLDPLESAYPLGQGMAYLQLGKVMLAEAAFTKALGLKHSLADALGGRARARIELDRLQDALADLDALLSAAPERLSDRVARGQVYRRMGLATKAVEEFAAVLAREPKAEGARLGKALALAGSGNLDGAIVDLSAEGQSARSAQSALLRAVLWSAKGDYRKAVADHNASVASEPLDAYPYFARAWTHAKFEQVALAIEDMDVALLLAPRSAAYLAFRADLLDKQGRTDAARKDRAALQADLDRKRACAGATAAVAGAATCLAPLQHFRDCEKCPEMVVIPAGTFMMGSPESEPERIASAHPQHRVEISRMFAVGRFAVTFEEWDECIASGGCGGYRAPDKFGRGRLPVSSVSWNDAKSFVEWLSGKTGQRYRLLSEAEREYVTRAGTQTPFWFGATITTEQANYGAYADLPEQFRGTTYGDRVKDKTRGRMVPVDSFLPNPWGLYQVHGNLSEWVEDCAHSDYNGAPTDGSAWLQCDGRGLRMTRGGNYRAPAALARSAFKVPRSESLRLEFTGFRVARDITPVQ